jgi:glycosyltransferase involved in cell wall biosynthesis
MSRRLRVLWVTAEPPVPGRSAAQERWRHLLRRLARRYDITVLTRSDDPADVGWKDDLGLAEAIVVPPPPIAEPDPLHLWPEGVRVGYVDHALRARLDALLASGRFDVVQYEYQEMTPNVPAAPAIPTVLTVMQIEFLYDAARWRSQAGPPRPWSIYRHLRNMDFELRALACAHRVIVMSPEDAGRLRRFVPDLHVEVSPIGADTREMQPLDPNATPDCDVLFLANFRHGPNVDAARWLADEILPAASRPIRARVVGREMAPELADHLRARGIDVRGPVDDPRPSYGRTHVLLAPVRFGNGMRGKVLEALAFGRPLVATTIGAEGLGAVDGTHLLLADDARAYARAIERLLDDPALAGRVGAAGRALIQERFDYDRIADDHARIYEEVVAHPGTPPRLPSDRSAPLAALARRLPMPLNGLLGAGLLVERGLRWYLRSLG